VADPRFLLQKKIEAWFHDRHPDAWIPAYTQVAFSPQIRYSEALANGRRQEAIMQEVLALPGIEHDWQTETVERLMQNRIGS
jgi:kynurenine 3-monooxygenase